MAGGDSDLVENKVLDWLFGRKTFDGSGTDTTVPATYYVALFTVTPSDAGGGTEVSTGAWTNYARVAVANTLTNFPAASGGAKATGADIDFGTAVIPGAGPTVVAMALMDAASGGNVVRWGPLTASKTPANGDPVKFPAGQLTLSHD